jgi:hypothetical protein
MTDLFYHETISGKKQIISPGYTVATPKISRNIFRQFLALSAAGGLLVAAVGLIVGIITPHAWASGIFVVGVGLFCIAGYLARHSENVRRRSGQWRPIT